MLSGIGHPEPLALLGGGGALASRYTMRAAYFNLVMLEGRIRKGKIGRGMAQK